MISIKTNNLSMTMPSFEEAKNNSVYSTNVNNLQNELHHKSPSSRELKKQRMNELLDSCRDEVLKQIIGPFGLNKAMFNDKDGGNVTTLHNFEQGVVANENDKERYDKLLKSRNDFDRTPYDKDLPKKRKEMFQNDNQINSAYTGKELSRDGKTHLDHVNAAENIERDLKSNLFMTQEQRVKMANSPENLVPCESDINQSMGKKDKIQWAESERKKNDGKTNAESFGVDEKKLRETKNQADQHINTEIAKAQFKKQGAELLQTGLKDAGNNALRQAMGLVLHELVNSSYLEVKRIARDPDLKENFVDNVIEAIKTTISRIIKKSEHIFKSVVSGGIQGFISNFLTFIINNIITTSAKIVTIIREGLKGLWDAIKLITNPPEEMSGIEIARQATKIITAVITTSLGLLFEKSIETFILSIPIFAPLAPIISPVVTALLTGIMTTFVMFGIERFFDWLNDTGTERLNTQIEHMEGSVGLFENMAQMMNSQFNNSQQYQQCSAQYGYIIEDFNQSQQNMSNTITIAESSIQNRDATIQLLHNYVDNFKVINENEIDDLLNSLQTLNKGK